MSGNLFNDPRNLIHLFFKLQSANNWNSHSEQFIQKQFLCNILDIYR